MSLIFNLMQDIPVCY